MSLEEKKYRCLDPDCTSKAVFERGEIPESRRLRFTFRYLGGEKKGQPYEVFKCPYCRGKIEEVPDGSMQ